MFTTSNVFGISIAPWIVWKINFYLYFISKMCKINFYEQIIQLFKSEPFCCQNILGELCCWCIGISLNIEMSSYQYRNFHYKDKTVSWRFIFIMKIPIPGKMVFILSRGALGAVSIYTCRLTGIGIPMLKTRRSHDHRILNMGISIPGKTSLYIPSDAKSSVAMRCRIKMYLLSMRKDFNYHHSIKKY